MCGESKGEIRDQKMGALDGIIGNFSLLPWSFTPIEHGLHRRVFRRENRQEKKNNIIKRISHIQDE